MSKSKWFRNSLASTLAAGILIPTLGAAPALPPQNPPFVRPMRAGESWEITVQKNPNANKGVPRTRFLTHISGKRSEDMRHEKYVWTDRETDRWMIGRMLIETGNDGNSLLPTKLSRNPEKIEKRLSEFQELNWIAPVHYKRIEQCENKTCHFYEFIETMIDDEPADDPESAGKPRVIRYERRAWIDIESGRPIASENPDFRFVYSFSTFSPPKLEPPQAVQEAAKACEPGTPLTKTL